MLLIKQTFAVKVEADLKDEQIITICDEIVDEVLADLETTFVEQVKAIGNRHNVKLTTCWD